MLGRPAIVEVDAFYLPDTSGTSYRAEHVKTSIGIQALDPDDRRLGYFHNAGYYELAGEDFAGVFRLEGHLTDPEYLPPYVEVAKLGNRQPLTGGDLVEASLALLRAHLARRPVTNPFRRYADAFRSDLRMARWASRSRRFHNYAFATLRQCGAAFELGGAYLRWLEAGGECGLERAAEAARGLPRPPRPCSSRRRAPSIRRRPLDAAPMLDEMAEAWDETMTTLTARYGS